MHIESLAVDTCLLGDAADCDLLEWNSQDQFLKNIHDFLMRPLIPLIPAGHTLPLQTYRIRQHFHLDWPLTLSSCSYYTKAGGVLQQLLPKSHSAWLAPAEPKTEGMGKMKKPPMKPLSREKLQKKVNLIRRIMSFCAKEMMDMAAAIGDDVWYDTDVGKVRALAYGFDDPAVKPLLVNIHGSGFVLGSAAMDDPFMMQFVDQCGVKVISIDYTLSPEVMYPVAQDQCYAVCRYAKAHAEELNIDPSRIMLMGHSAGGNFCAAIGLRENEKGELGLKGIILDYPPTDIATDPYDKPLPKGCLPPKMCRMFNAAYCTPEQAKSPLVSPTFAAEEMVRHFPPTLVITAGNDSLAGETERLKDTMLRAGVDVTFRRFEGVHHGFTITGRKNAKKNPADFAAFLEAWKMMVDFVNQHI